MKVYFGGWYQRTTLHLSELFDLFAYGKSQLNLASEKLASLKSNLDFNTVERQYDFLEYILAKTNSGITLKYYEDGLYVLETETDDIMVGQTLLEDYFNQKLNPAVSYIFSLGAPTPKVLANIKTVHPTIVATIAKIEIEKYGQVYSKISSQGITVYKTPSYIFVTAPANKKEIIEGLVGMQIFFREFKDQMEKYLNIHRVIWEEISKLRNQEYITGRQVPTLISKLENYQYTINLISSRINQMTVYINTRSSIAQKLSIVEDLSVLFKYKFEGLADTHKYIQELWSMTIRYLNDSLTIVRSIEAKTLNTSIQSLQIITSIGVFSGIIGYLSRDKLPSINTFGVIYLLGLLTIVWGVNKLIKILYKNTRYHTNFPKHESLNDGSNVSHVTYG